MEYTPFAPLLRRIMDGRELAVRPREGELFSLPVAMRRGDIQYDALFLYQRPGDEPEPTSPRPFAWLLLEADGGRVALFSQCALVDFVPSGLLDDGPLPMQLPKLTVGKKRTVMMDKLMAAYEEIREFVFEENLTRPQAAAVSTYKDMFTKLSYPAHYPFYHALSPAFFHWLRMPLPKEAQRDPGRAISEIQSDGYQLLILENLRQLVRQFQDKIATDSHKEKLFDEMHRELQEYRKDLVGTLTQAMERDVIQVIDGIAKSTEMFRGREGSPEDYRRLFTMFEGVETDLCDLLYRHGVEPYSHRVGLDLTRQKIVQTVPTADQAKDKTVASRIGRGWEKEGKIIRPERISVYVYDGAGGAAAGGEQA